MYNTIVWDAPIVTNLKRIDIINDWRLHVTKCIASTSSMCTPASLIRSKISPARPAIKFRAGTTTCSNSVKTEPCYAGWHSPRPRTRWNHKEPCRYKLDCLPRVWPFNDGKAACRKCAAVKRACSARGIRVTTVHGSGASRGRTTWRTTARTGRVSTR